MLTANFKGLSYLIRIITITQDCKISLGSFADSKIVFAAYVRIYFRLYSIFCTRIFIKIVNTDAQVSVLNFNFTHYKLVMLNVEVTHITDTLEYNLICEVAVTLLFDCFYALCKDNYRF